MWKQDKVRVTHCDRTLLSCDAMKPVQRPKLTSPLERERGPSRSKSQAVPRPAAEWGVPAGGRSPCQGGLGAQPGTCGASQKFCPGQELAKGAAVGGQPGGHSGCNAHVLVAVGCCSGMAAALRGPPAPKAGGWFGIPPPPPRHLGSGELRGHQRPAAV